MNVGVTYLFSSNNHNSLSVKSAEAAKPTLFNGITSFFSKIFKGAFNTNEKMQTQHKSQSWSEDNIKRNLKQVSDGSQQLPPTFVQATDPNALPTYTEATRLESAHLLTKDKSIEQHNATSNVSNADNFVEKKYDYRLVISGIENALKNVARKDNHQKGYKVKASYNKAQSSLIKLKKNISLKNTNQIASEFIKANKDIKSYLSAINPVFIRDEINTVNRRVGRLNNIIALEISKNK